MLRYGLVPVLAFWLTVGPCPAQPLRPKASAPGAGKQEVATKGEKKLPTSRDLLRMLDDTIDTTPFPPMTLHELLSKFSAAFAAKGKDLRIRIDAQAFQAVNPDADISETRVAFPQFPRRMKFREALRIALNCVPTENATFLIRRGLIEITTMHNAAPQRLLKERVAAVFENRPLADALEELADLTGATILVDPRLGEKARTPVSAMFRNTITLKATVRSLAQMAGLNSVDVGNAVFVTSPEIAMQMRVQRRGK